MKMALARWLALLLCVIAFMPCRAQDAQQQFEFSAPVTTDDAAAPAAMRDLAERVLPVYEEKDRDRYLSNVSALQLAAGHHQAAHDSWRSLRERRRDLGQSAGHDLLFDLYAQARATEAEGGISFTQAFTAIFRDAFSRLGDREAYAVTEGLAAPLTSYRQAVQIAFDQLRNKKQINLDEATDVVLTWIYFDIYRSAGTLIEALASEDDRRRYVVEAIKIPGYAGIRAQLVRPRQPARSPTLLEFTISSSYDDARACAAHGYAGVVAYTRSKNPSAQKPQKPGGELIVPFEHDGEDAVTVIRWIARQAWSDGRVGMYGNGYSAFAAWAAAKHLPRALKAIAASDAMAPGIDFPMQGQIFRNASYRWASSHTRPVDEVDTGDPYWRALDETWYKSGKRYRDLDAVVKKPNGIFQLWLDHPGYDHYWQKMIPFREQFARIDIPVLATTGYYAAGRAGAGQAGTLHYFTQHRRYKPGADHTLLIGPYEDGATGTALNGAPIDPAARIDLHELRFQWFDYVLRRGAKPSLLQDRVNYEVMGANEWRHAPSLEAMAGTQLRFYLDFGGHRLTQGKPSNATPVTQAIAFSDRSDASWLPSTRVVSSRLAPRYGAMFVSEPLTQPLEISGLITGQLELQINRLDLDLNVTLYELLASGDYLQLSDAHEFRASYAGDRVHRRLLQPGARQQVKFTTEQMISRKLPAGSRVALVLGVNKRPDREINYGTRKAVAEASVADAKIPLKILWYGGSYIDVPVQGDERKP